MAQQAFWEVHLPWTLVCNNDHETVESNPLFSSSIWLKSYFLRTGFKAQVQIIKQGIIFEHFWFLELWLVDETKQPYQYKIFQINVRQIVNYLLSVLRKLWIYFILWNFLKRYRTLPPSLFNAWMEIFLMKSKWSYFMHKLCRYKC